MVKEYLVRVHSSDLRQFYDFCARTTLKEHQESNGFKIDHNGTILFSLIMTNEDSAAMKLALPVSIMIAPRSVFNTLIGANHG